MRAWWLLPTLAILAAGCGQGPVPAPVVFVSSDVPPSSPLSDASEAPIIPVAPSPASTADGAGTPEATQVVIALSEDALDTTTPSELIREVRYFIGGAGGSECDAEYLDGPGFGREDESKNGPVELLSTIQATVCGLKVGETVSVRVGRPDGTVQEYEVTAQQMERREAGYSDFDYALDEHAPTGQYVVSFSGASWQLRRTVTVVAPESARLYLLDNSTLRFYNFQPYERVRLLVYREKEDQMGIGLRLLGWTVYQVDGQGGLSVTTNMDTDVRYVALGELSGQVGYRLPRDSDRIYRLWTGLASSADFTCPGAPAPVGWASDRLAIVTVESLPLVANYDEDQSGTLAKRTVLAAFNNPTCLDGAWWWDVACAGPADCKGRVQEADPDGPHLLPLPDLNTEGMLCLGHPATSLDIGSTGRVIFSPETDPLNLRQASGISGDILGTLHSGSVFTVIGGPECKDGFRWWKIWTEDDRIGWAADGDAETSFIEPY